MATIVVDSSDDEPAPAEEAPMSFDFESATGEDEEDSDGFGPAASLPRLSDHPRRNVAGGGLTEWTTLQTVVESRREVESSTDGASEAGMGRRSKIEIVIRPLPAHVRAQYKVTPPSDHVGSVLEEISSLPREEWYRIEYDDGRVDQVRISVSLLFCSLPSPLYREVA